MDIDQLINLVKQNQEQANTKVINYLSDHNFNINQCNKYGFNLLVTSIKYNNFEIFNYLITRDVNLLEKLHVHEVFRPFIYLCNPIDLTLEENKVQFLDKLLSKLTDKSVKEIFDEDKHGIVIINEITVETAKVISKYGYKFSTICLSIAIWFGSFELLKYYIEDLNFDIETKDEEGNSLLNQSVISITYDEKQDKRFAITKYLVDKGANLEHYPNDSTTGILQRAIYKGAIFSKSVLYLLEHNINYDVFDIEINKKFMNHFLDQRCDNNLQASSRFQIFEKLLIKQFFKHSELFQKVPIEFKKDVEAQIEQILQNRDIRLGTDEYIKKVIILNPSKPISELALKYELKICKNSEMTEGNDKPEQKNELPAAKPSFISIPSHIASLKELAALAVLTPKLKEEVEDQLWTLKTLLPQELEIFVAAINVLESLLAGNSAVVNMETEST